MANLRMRYLGLDLANPVVASASPLSKQVDTVRRLEAAGTAAVVVYSLFEEQIEHESLELDHYLGRGEDAFSEAASFFPDLGHYNVGASGYLDHIAALKRAVDIPIIGSLNGMTAGGWVDYARRIEQAGADALELNIYYLPTDPRIGAGELETRYVELVEAVRAEVEIPIAIKLGPWFTALPHFAARLAAAGADGLVLFNRFYQPEIDIEALEVVPDVTLSSAGELRLPLRWIAILSSQLPIDYAATSGIGSAEGVIKAIMAGANVAMMTSELLRRGPQRVRAVLDDLERWLDANGYDAIAPMRGSMNQRAVGDPAAFERANYMKALASFDQALP